MRLCIKASSPKGVLVRVWFIRFTSYFWPCSAITPCSTCFWPLLWTRWVKPKRWRPVKKRKKRTKKRERRHCAQPTDQCLQGLIQCKFSLLYSGCSSSSNFPWRTFFLSSTFSFSMNVVLNHLPAYNKHKSLFFKIPTTNTTSLFSAIFFSLIEYQEIKLAVSVFLQSNQHSYYNVIGAPKIIKKVASSEFSTSRKICWIVDLAASSAYLRERGGVHK